MSELYIGLMSGTSADGIDAALVDLSHPQPKLIAHHSKKYTPELRKEILTLCQPGPDEINRLGKLDVTLGKQFATVVNEFLKKTAIKPQKIRAIGSHGQTVRHHPSQRFTLQIADPNIIAAETGITTVADFRRRDLALGGQGAPLVPAFHQALFSSGHQDRVILNLGGMANVTLLTKDGQVKGFDTGPGNVLIDAWIEKNLQHQCDHYGKWAAQGKINEELLKNLLSDPFFKMLPPKSTGREYFNSAWLEKFLTKDISPVDVQTTVTELTARSVVDAIPFQSGEILLCGGGANNSFLVSRILANAKNFAVMSTEKWGVHPDWVEAMAFAWLAKQTLDGKAGNVPAVTGASVASVLGGIFYT